MRKDYGRDELEKNIVLLPREVNISLNGKEWMVIALSQRFKSINDILKNINFDITELTEILKSLEKRGVIKISSKEAEISEGSKKLPTLFWKALQTELSTIIGPIASTLIEEELEEINENKGTFTYQKAAGFIEKISLEIDNASQRMVFQKKMLEVLKRL
ncbi:hypothetical protein KFV02_07345 [Desulfohalobiaceae bacterium Ax17]|uniref:hypothetical protein n=1 Tax=Desulfovulcanus ferrireducens TaxID=2831190 RepID=UPI00207BA44F|nr:hypothetical protein [Desulfovulcanus ferrireducens]MBT8763745.1 hypothetical protein [Desulfovulcanus ferrireducens]